MAAKRKAKRPRKQRSDRGQPRVPGTEKRAVTAYSLPPRFIAALAAVAKARTQRTGAPVSASAVLASVLAPRIEELEREAGQGV